MSRLLEVECRQWTQWQDVVRTGDPSRAGSVRADVETYATAMEALSGGVAQALTAASDFGDHQRLLDLGGGTGAHVATAVQAHPHLHGTLFDLPETAALARQRLADTPAADRIDVVAGDFVTDALPEGHDAVLLSDIVSNFPPEDVPTPQ